MINRKDIAQKTLEWHEIKWGKIGGSSSKGLFVKSDTLLIDILSQRMEDFEPKENDFVSDDMERGNDLEPFAREYLNHYTGLEFIETGWLQSEENELLGISPDGLTECETIACEIKCFARKKHFSVLLSNEIPLENIHQIVHYFTVNPKLQKLYFIAFRPEAPNHFIKEVTKETIVNLGTKVKPNLMSIEAARDYALEFAKDLLITVKEKENQLLNTF